jgi:hypothetical protein
VEAKSVDEPAINGLVRGYKSNNIHGIHRHNQIPVVLNHSNTIHSPKYNVCKLDRLPISDGIEEISL